MAITAVPFLPPFPNPVPKRRCYDAQGNLLRQDRNNILREPSAKGECWRTGVGRRLCTRSNA
jgi:hypothetical protein